MKNPENMTKKELIETVKALIAQNDELIQVPQFVREQRQFHQHIVDIINGDDYEADRILQNALDEGYKKRRETFERKRAERKRAKLRA
jgi:hypothetical protein